MDETLGGWRLSQLRASDRFVGLCEYHGRMVDLTLLAQAKQLTVADRLELIGELWQTLDHDGLPVTEAERVMLDERIVELSVNPDSGHSWGDVGARLRNRVS